MKSRREIDRLINEFEKEAQFWRETKEDPYNIANAVICALESIASVLRRAAKQRKNTR